MTHPSAITAGDTIYVGEQRCDVISSDADLAANYHSTADAICTHDTIEVSFEGSTQSCTSTDRPALRFIHDNPTSTSTDQCIDASACAEVLAYNGANRLVRWSSGNGDTDLS